MADLFMAPPGSSPDDPGSWTYLGQTDGPVRFDDRHPRPVVVNCDQHGPMKRREDTLRWECPGFDGEGCDTVITDEDVARLQRAGLR